MSKLDWNEIHYSKWLMQSIMWSAVPRILSSIIPKRVRSFKIFNGMYCVSCFAVKRITYFITLTLTCLLIFHCVWKKRSLNVFHIDFLKLFFDGMCELPVLCWWIRCFFCYGKLGKIFLLDNEIVNRFQVLQTKIKGKLKTHY